MLGYFITFSFALLVAAFALAFARLAMGPTLPDRVVALELIAALVVGLIGVYAILTDTASFIDVGIVVALMGFLAAVGFARYLEKGGLRDA